MIDYVLPFAVVMIGSVALALRRESVRRVAVLLILFVMVWYLFTEPGVIVRVILHKAALGEAAFRDGASMAGKALDQVHVNAGVMAIVLAILALASFKRR